MILQPETPRLCRPLPLRACPPPGPDFPYPHTPA